MRNLAHDQVLLRAYRQEISDWLGRLLSIDHVTEHNLMDVLATGTVVCRLANTISSARGGSGRPLRRLQFHASASPGSFLARDNIAVFIDWAKQLGVPTCFETSDIAECKNEKSVLFW